jgi:hypothetical protein
VLTFSRAGKVCLDYKREVLPQTVKGARESALRGKALAFDKIAQRPTYKLGVFFGQHMTETMDSGLHKFCIYFNNKNILHKMAVESY